MQFAQISDSLVFKQIHSDSLVNPSYRMRPQIVLFGDSITEQSFRAGGWGAALADTYSRKADVLVRGYGGYNTRWALFLLHHLFPMGSEKPPVSATVFFGANDAALLGRTGERQHVPVEEYKENLRRIVQHLKNCSPAVLVVLITPPPVDEQGRLEFARSLYGDKATKLPERTNASAAVYAKQCVELAKELGLPSINLWSKMQETDGWQKKFLSDGLHLTAEGNAIVHEEVVKVFSEAGLSAPKMPNDFPHHSEIDGDNPEKAFQNLCAGADVLLRGYSGYNTRRALPLLEHLFPLGSAKPPVAATIFFGANDAALLGRTSEWQHVPVEEYKENLRKIIQLLKNWSSTVLVVLITPRFHLP